jgi:hypothetical protein
MPVQRLHLAARQPTRVGAGASDDILWMNVMPLQEFRQNRRTAQPKVTTSRTGPTRHFHNPDLSPRALADAIRKCWRPETSYNAAEWSRSNPAAGQCAVTALIVQDFLGGKLLRGQINGEEHYWNILPNRRQLDLTREQFANATMGCPPADVDREYVLSYSDTRRRYERLLDLVATALHNLNSEKP